MTEKEIIIFENTLKNHNIKSPNELAKKLYEMENDKNVIRGLQNAVKERDELIAESTDNLLKLKKSSKIDKKQLEETKTSSLNDKLKLIKEVKQKDQRIAELEEENKTLQKNYIEMVKKEVEENYFDLLKDLQLYKDDNAKLEKENAKLKEQLKNAFCPKYNLNQNVYVIRWGKPYRTRIDVVKAILIDGIVQIFYEYDAPGSYTHVEISEDGVFATEAEAQKYLEEHE